MRKSLSALAFVCMLLYTSCIVQAQETNEVQAGIFNSSGATLAVRVTPSVTFTNLPLSNVQFTIRWLNSYGVSLGAVVSPTYIIAKQGVEATKDDGGQTYRYQKFGAVTGQSITWPAGVAQELMTVDVNQTGTGTGTFELGTVAFTASFDGQWYIEIGGMNRTNQTFNPGSVSNVPLPVELSSFTAAVKSNAVNLTWQTATEVNNYGFNVERNAVSLYSDWQTIGFVEGHGNSNSPKDYSFVDNKISVAGKYYYRLKQIDRDGSFKYSEQTEATVDKPTKYELSQSYPNPFNPSTTIRFSIPEESLVKLIVHNTLGQEVKTLVNEKKQPGYYEVTFDGSEVASGVYFYRLETGKFVEVRKMLLLK